ncbi:MAG: redoxin domain-containing protein [Actinomycetota bacterium]|nr:redoxin domain-containing protein [Actinomycetota bacterium]
MILLRDRREEFERGGVSVFGISRDSPWSHIAWRQALDLELPLLSDWNGEAVRAFGITQTYRGLREVAERSAFLVGGDGVLSRAWRYEPAELPDFVRILAAARELAQSSA